MSADEWECEEQERQDTLTIMAMVEKITKIEAENQRLREKAEKWDRLEVEDPDATIILADQLNEACLELDELRQRLEAIREILNKNRRFVEMQWFKEILEVLGDE